MGFLAGLGRQAGPLAARLREDRLLSEAEKERKARQKTLDERYEREQERRDLAEELTTAQVMQEMGGREQEYAAQAARAQAPGASYDMINGKVANVEEPYDPTRDDVLQRSLQLREWDKANPPPQRYSPSESRMVERDRRSQKEEEAFGRAIDLLTQGAQPIAATPGHGDVATVLVHEFGISRGDAARIATEAHRYRLGTENTTSTINRRETMGGGSDFNDLIDRALGGGTATMGGGAPGLGGASLPGADPEAQMDDADLWDKKVTEGMQPEQATEYVKNRRR